MIWIGILIGIPLGMVIGILLTVIVTTPKDNLNPKDYYVDTPIYTNKPPANCIGEEMISVDAVVDDIIKRTHEEQKCTFDE